MLPVAEALPRILQLFPRLSSEQVPLHSALGRTLAQNLTARLPLPAFDNSAMDGYALRYADLNAGETTLPLCGEIAAGAQGSGPLLEQSAFRIFTGAPMPRGADTVVMQENTRRDGERVVILERPRAAGANVRQRGSDVEENSPLLPLGTLMGPGEIALCAAQGLSSCPVVRRPRVAILSTGSELVEPHDAHRPFSVVNSNAYALAALVEEAGAVPWVLPAAPDELNVIKERLNEALSADAVLCSGGVSVGDHDLVARAFNELGVITDFWKVAIKPGKPIRVGHKNGTPVVGLPGNPVSAMVTFELFVRPGLLRMAGHEAFFRPVIEAALAEPYVKKAGRTEFARATLSPQTSPPTVRLHSSQSSGAMRSMVGVDALAILPRNRGALSAGDRIHALLLRPAALVGQASHPLLDPEV